MCRLRAAKILWAVHAFLERSITMAQAARLSNGSALARAKTQARFNLLLRWISRCWFWLEPSRRGSCYEYRSIFCLGDSSNWSLENLQGCLPLLFRC